MEDSSTYSNLIKLDGITQVKWVCYTQIIPKEGLEYSKARPAILNSYWTLLRDKIPCFLSLENLNNTTNILLVLFVFYFKDPLPDHLKKAEINELKTGIVTSEMLRRFHASDIQFDRNELFSLKISNSIDPKFNQSSTLPIKLKDFTELDLFLFALRNIISNEFKGKGGIQLGRSYLFRENPEEKSSKSGYRIKKYRAIDLDPWIIHSSVYFKPSSKSVNIVNAFESKTIKTGSEVLLSPYGLAGKFMNFEPLPLSLEKREIKAWSNRADIPLYLIDPYHNKPNPRIMGSKEDPSRFCVVWIPSLDIKLLYPTMLVFYVDELVQEPITPSPTSIKNMLDILNSALVLNSFSSLDVREPHPLPVDSKKVNENKGNQEDINAFDYSKAFGVDSWFDSLSLTTKEPPKVPPNKVHLEESLGLNSLEFASPVNAPPSLISGPLGGTDPTPPTDTDFPLDPDGTNNLGLGSPGDFLINGFPMDEFEHFDLTETDFNFFDKVDAKNTSNSSIQLEGDIEKGVTKEKSTELSNIKREDLFTETQQRYSNSNEVPLVKDEANAYDTPPKTSNSSLPVMNRSDSPNISNLREKKEKPLSKKVIIRVVSKDPWVSDRYSPLPIVMNRNFLPGGKFARLSTRPSKIYPLTYGPYYRPTPFINNKNFKRPEVKYKPLSPKQSYFIPPPSYKPQFTLPITENYISKKQNESICSSTSVSEAESENEFSLKEETLDKMSNSNGGTTNLDEDNDKSKGLVFSPDFAGIWLRTTQPNFRNPHDTTASLETTVDNNSIEFLNNKNSNIWEDPVILRIFMDLLRTHFIYPDEIVRIGKDYEHALCFNSNTNDAYIAWKDTLDVLDSLVNVFKSDSNDASPFNTAQSPCKLEGPLTINDCYKPNQNSTNDHQSSISHLGAIFGANQNETPLNATLNPITSIPHPRIQAFTKTGLPLELSIASTAYWSEMGLKPIFGSKDISVMTIFPQDGFSQLEIENFFRVLFKAYKDLSLGVIRMLYSSNLNHGYYPLPKDSTDPNEIIKNLAALTNLLGEEIANLKYTQSTFPSNLMLLYFVPETLTSSVALWTISCCFRNLISRLDGILPSSCQIHCQMLQVNVLHSHQSNQLPLDYFIKLSFDLYSRFYKVNTADTIDFTNLIPHTFLSFSPPFYLSPPPPIHINFNIPQNDAPLFSYANTLHLTYSWGADLDCIIAVWIDDTGQALDHTLLPVSSSSFSDYSYLIDQLFQATKKFQARVFKYPPRIAVTKLGIMEQAEIETWKKFIVTVPGSCVMCAGYPSGLSFFNTDFTNSSKNDFETPSLILCKTLIPVSRNMFSIALGILSYSSCTSHFVEVYLLSSTFHLTTPPQSLIEGFRKVLTQLNNFRLLDASMSPKIANGFHPNTIRGEPNLCDRLLPLPWRWVLNAYFHLKSIKKSELAFS